MSNGTRMRGQISPAYSERFRAESTAIHPNTQEKSGKKTLNSRVKIDREGSLIGVMGINEDECRKNGDVSNSESSLEEISGPVNTNTNSMKSNKTKQTTPEGSIVRRIPLHDRTVAQSKRRYSFALGSPENPVRLDESPEPSVETCAEGRFVSEASTERKTERGNDALKHRVICEVNREAEFNCHVVVVSSDEEEREISETELSLQKPGSPCVKAKSRPKSGTGRRSSVRIQGNPKPVYCYSRQPKNLAQPLDLAAGRQPKLLDSDSSIERDSAAPGQKSGARGRNGAVTASKKDAADETAAVTSPTSNVAPTCDSTASSVLALSDEARVKDTLRIFNAYFLHFAKEEEDRCNRAGSINGHKGSKRLGLRKGEHADGTSNEKTGERRVSRRPDLKALSKVIETKAILYPIKQFGHLPGINVGDHFFSRAEMVALGFHSRWLNGIDYMAKPYDKMEHKGYKFPLAVSIILSGIYEDDVDNSEDIIYTGQGGNNLLGDKRQVKDQEMLRGNLALKNNMDEGVPVRVIRGHHSKNSYSGKVYTYDGLYKVVQYWAEKGLSGFTVFKFRLKRLEGQPILTTDKVYSIRANIPRCLSEIQGLVCEDISKGQENFPIPASNVVDDTPFPPRGYEYRKNLIIGKGVNVPTSGRGCKCKGECIDPKTCSCAILNGTDFPYVRRDGGRLVEAKDVLFECGPTCGCGPDCVNRTSQQGLKYRLEVFRTTNKGWGVRSWDFIPAGAPICEYSGILTRSDDLDTVSENNFIFEIDCLQTMKGIDGRQRRLGDVSRHDNVQIEKLVDKKVDAQAEFCIDAGTCGNVSRFINHSCEPNLFVQCVLSSHHDIRLARIVLFAADNIPPLQELTYDYGYSLDSVVGEDGEIKKMACYCGVVGCRKRLY